MPEYPATALALTEAIRDGEMTSEEAAAASLAAIERFDGRLGAFLSVGDPVDPPVDGILRGLPYAAKDNLCTRDFPTTCASGILADYTPPYDATAIAGMTRAGARLVGKTNMDEFAMGSSNENSGIKPTRNPWDLQRVPGGSSGGSAAAVAAGLVPLALGTDTGGSIRQPASFCGITGMKPTYGSVSRLGLIAFASSLDQIGPLGRTARDCALAMDVLVGRDAGDSTSIEHPHAGQFLQAALEERESLRGVRIGLPAEYYAEGIDPEVARVARRAAKTLEDLGAIVEEISLPHTAYALPVYYILASAEASSNLARFDGVRYGLRAAADDIDDLYRRTRGEGFGEEVKRRIMLGTYALSAGYYDDLYVKAARVRRVMVRELEEAFKVYDYLLTPTSPTPAFCLGERTEDPLAMYMADLCTIPANMAGIPAISFPGGFVGDLPVGVQLMGPRLSDAGILATADLFQRVTDYHRVRPPLWGGDTS